MWRRQLAGILVIVASGIILCLVRGVCLAQDIGWAEWYVCYENEAQLDSTGAQGSARTTCYHYSFFKDPLYLAAEAWLYHGLDLEDHDGGWRPGDYNEVRAEVFGEGPQDDLWWFCAYHGCQPTNELYDEWYVDYAVPDSRVKYGPTDPAKVGSALTGLDLQASLYYLALVGDRLAITSEPARICSVLSGRYAFLGEQERKALLRLYVDELAPAYHNKPGDIMPGFFSIGGSYAIIFPHKAGDYEIVTLDWSNGRWVIREVYHGETSDVTLRPGLE
ncbi:MAG TPA: hypothetical protein GX510_06905 [Firmicutes bacterium]|nr:hypothetical protein [Candidatus Fermentithermobacillaceae bacterium]